jgi:two-component sensor histidine kinase
MKRLLVFLFFITINISYGQTKLLDSLRPKTTLIKNVFQYKKAITYFEEAIKNKRSEYSFFKNHLQLAENCLQWCEQYEDEQAIIKTKYYIFHYYNNQFKANTETIYRARELLTFKKFLEMKESVFVLFVLRIAYNDSKQYDELLKLLPLYYEQEKKFGRAFGETNEDKIKAAEQGLIDAYAHLYYNIKNYKQAQKYFKIQLKYLKSIESHYSISYLISSCENNLGLCYLSEKKNDSALFYFNSALNTINNKIVGLKNIDTDYLEHFINVINANKASIDIENKMYNKALPPLFKALISSKKTKEIHIELDSYYQIAQIFYYKNKPNLSLQYLDSIFKLVKPNKNGQLKVNALQLKARNLMLLGNINEANNVFKVQQNLIDSLEQEKINSNYTQESIKLDVENKTKQLIDSKKEIEKKEKIGLYQKIGIALLLLVIVGLFVVYKKYRGKSKIIQEQKIIVDRSLKQKEILLKEVHHRVKNNLQLISGLLNLQLQKHKHLDIKEMMNESQNHINSIALAHEMLYQDDDISLISMQKYFQELGIRSLQVSSTKKIKYKTDVENIYLPINYATTLGLIFNELITNSIKHAFKKNTGTISVYLNKHIDENKYSFIYKDNGIGMDLSKIEETSTSLGLKLVKMLAEELDAQMQAKNNNGLVYTFIFTNKSKTDV